MEIKEIITFESLMNLGNKFGKFHWTTVEGICKMTMKFDKKHLLYDSLRDRYIVFNQSED